MHFNYALGLRDLKLYIINFNIIIGRLISDIFSIFKFISSHNYATDDLELVRIANGRFSVLVRFLAAVFLVTCFIFRHRFKALFHAHWICIRQQHPSKYIRFFFDKILSNLRQLRWKITLVHWHSYFLVRFFQVVWKIRPQPRVGKKNIQFNKKVVVGTSYNQFC